MQEGTQKKENARSAAGSGREMIQSLEVFPHSRGVAAADRQGDPLDGVVGLEVPRVLHVLEGGHVQGLGDRVACGGEGVVVTSTKLSTIKDKLLRHGHKSMSTKASNLGTHRPG
jgi:hypothetical protein